MTRKYSKNGWLKPIYISVIRFINFMKAHNIDSIQHNISIFVNSYKPDPFWWRILSVVTLNFLIKFLKCFTAVLGL